MVSMLFRYAYRMEFDGKEASFYFMDDASCGFVAKRLVSAFQDSMIRSFPGLNYSVESDLGAELFIVRVPTVSLFAVLFRSVKCHFRVTNRKVFSLTYEISQIPPAPSESLEAEPAAHPNF